MIAELIQTYSGLSAEATLYSQESVLGHVHYPNNFTFGAPFYLTAGQSQYTFSPQSVEIGFTDRSPNDKPASHIREISFNQQKYASLLRVKQELGFINSFEYIQLATHMRYYDMYEVGLGKAGIVYPIYCNDKLVAEIWKNCKVLDNLDQYTLIALTPVDMLHAYMLAAYADSMSYANRGQLMKRGIDITVYKTTNKHLLNMYQPEFHKYMGLDISKFAV